MDSPNPKKSMTSGTWALSWLAVKSNVRVLNVTNLHIMLLNASLATMNQVLLHPSEVNRLTETYDGIDVCGLRLAQEIRSVVAAHPKLERISVVGHSMGGLLLRYAIGVLYDPDDSSIAGLQPCHFVSMATPHMGCDAEGLAQVGKVPSLAASLCRCSCSHPNRPANRLCHDPQCACDDLIHAKIVAGLACYVLVDEITPDFMPHICRGTVCCTIQSEWILFETCLSRFKKSHLMKVRTSWLRTTRC